MAIKPKFIKALLIGGPAHGQEMQVAAGTERIFLGRMFEYTLAGLAKSKATLYAIAPRAHAHRRWLWNYIGTTGTDPRPEAFANRRVPLVYTDANRPSPYGRGARKRAERKANASNVD